MNIVVLTITHRTLNNIAPVIRLLLDRGASCKIIWAPTSQAIRDQTPADFGFPLALDLSDLMNRTVAAPEAFAERCRQFMLREAPDLIVSDDMTALPNRIVYDVVKQIPDRPWHIAWQHGLHQPWYEMRERFDADFFLCYGYVHTLLLGKALAPRVLPVGLPKLDRLGDVPTSQGGFLSWFAQPLPPAQLQLQLLSDIAAKTGLPVHIRPHPAAPDAFGPNLGSVENRGLRLDDPRQDPIDTLRMCNGFLSTHSSAALEALLLNKSAILFPSFGLTSFVGYPHVASEFTVRAYQVAIGRYPARRSAAEAFLVDMIGGRRFDHTARAVAAIETLHSMRNSAAHPCKLEWWKTNNALRSAMQSVHPLVPA